MRKQKEYSTLKVQQEMLKAYYKDYNSASGYGMIKLPCGDSWYIYKGIAMYKADKVLLTNIRSFEIYNLIHELEILREPLEILNIHVPITDNYDKKLIYLKDKYDNEHKLDFNLFNVVNLDPYKCQLFTNDKGKSNIVAVRTEESELLAGIMEVK